LLIRSAAQVFLLRRAQGRIEEIEPMIASAVERYPGIPAFRASLALVRVELGRNEEARLQLERLAADEFAALPRDGTWLSAMTALAEVAAALGEQRHAAVLYDRLEPYGGRYVVVSFGHGCEGAVSRFLGLLATTLSRFDEAERYFADARARHTRMGAPLLLARTDVAEAEMCLRRGGPADFERTRELVESVEGVGRDFGELAAPIARLRARLVAPATKEPRLFQREGDYWTLDFGGRRLRVKDSKGVRYLQVLMHHPGREFHATDLASRAEAADGDADPRESAGADLPRRASSTDAGEILDARAGREYRRRLGELAKDLEEATRRNDPGETERIGAELEAVRRELSA
ncbi:MAG: hypothetical protein ACREQY_00950, partial [Candidatus Binatia bacterium]